jgi:hypothetical protein
MLQSREYNQKGPKPTEARIDKLSFQFLNNSRKKAVTPPPPTHSHVSQCVAILYQNSEALAHKKSWQALRSCHFSVNTGWYPPDMNVATSSSMKSNELKSLPCGSCIPIRCISMCIWAFPALRCSHLRSQECELPACLFSCRWLVREKEAETPHMHGVANIRGKNRNTAPTLKICVWVAEHVRLRMRAIPVTQGFGSRVAAQQTVSIVPSDRHIESV